MSRSPVARLVPVILVTALATAFAPRPVEPETLAEPLEGCLVVVATIEGIRPTVWFCVPTTD